MSLIRDLYRRKLWIVCFIIASALINILFILNESGFEWRSIVHNGHVRVGSDKTVLRKLKPDKTWKHVGNDKILFVYSAYFIENENMVKIIGMIKKNVVNVTCVFRFQANAQHTNHGAQDIVNATVEKLPENQNKKYKAVYVKCPVTVGTIPATVGVRLKSSTTYLGIQYVRARHPRYNFTVCVSCLHGPYNKYYQMIETMEADLMFGADHFLFYNYSASEKVNKALQKYIDRGIVEVFDWNLPVLDVHYFGQIAFLHDCILASQFQSKYLIFKDLDEMIVPHKHKNWYEMVEFLEKEHPKAGSFLFRSSFFHLDWEQDIENFKMADKAKKLKLNSLLNLWREKDFYYPMTRSKMMVRPEHVITTGIHFVRELDDGYREIVVDPELSYLHHYRSIKNKIEKVKDVAMRKFAPMLIRNVEETLSKM